MNVEIIKNAEFSVFLYKISRNPTYFTVTESSSLAVEHIAAEKCDKLYAWMRFLLLGKGSKF